MKAKLVQYNTKNLNGHIYTEEAIDNAINDEEFKEKLNLGCLYGELDPDYNRDVFDTDMTKAAIRVNSIQKDKENNCYTGDIEVLNTPQGKIVSELINNTKVGIAIRGLVSIDDMERQYEEDIELPITKINKINIVSFDIVQNPAFEDCIINNNN